MGSTSFWLNGEAAFQEVFHTHLHVVPRVEGDGFTFEATAWSVSRAEPRALDANAAAIRAALSQVPDKQQRTTTSRLKPLRHRVWDGIGDLREIGRRWT